MKSLTDRYEEAQPLYPINKHFRKSAQERQVTLSRTKQLTFSRFFENELIEKSKDNPLGNFRYLEFQLAFNAGIHVWNREPVLLISFLDKEVMRKGSPATLEITTRFPKSIVKGFCLILDTLHHEHGIDFEMKPGWKHVWQGNSLKVDIENKLCVLSMRHSKHIQTRRKHD